MFLLPFALTIFGRSTSSGLSERFSFGASAGAACSFFAFADFLAAFGASAGAVTTSASGATAAEASLTGACNAASLSAFFVLDGFARAFARARVRGRALAAHRQSATMPNAAIAIDCLQTLQIPLHFTPKIAFDLQFISGDCLDDFVDLLRREIFRPQIRIDVRLIQNAFRRARPDSINVGKRCFDAFFR